MQPHLTLVCDAARAFVYTSQSKNLKLIDELTHPESREKGSDLVSDRAGHFKTDHTARSAYESHQSPKDHEKEHFAEILAHYLEKGLQEKVFERCVIIAPPHFWGLLERHLSKHVSEAVHEVIQKDYTSFTQRELQEILQ